MLPPHVQAECPKLRALAWDQVKAQANLNWHMSPRDILRALQTMAKMGDR